MRQRRAAELRAEEERRQAAERKAEQRRTEEQQRPSPSEGPAAQSADAESEQPAEPAGTGPVGQGDYVVKQGECIDSVAMEHGFFWETLWNDANNTELREVRKDPFVLLPDDRVFIPELRRKQESGETEQKHRFRRKGLPSIFRLQLLSGGEPRADEPFRLVIDGASSDGRTDSDGRIEVPIPPNASRGELIVGEEDMNQQTIDLNLGGIDPITEISGVQARLENLGLCSGQSGELDQDTRAAIAAFQRAQQMEPTGEADEVTRERLLQVHGS